MNDKYCPLIDDYCVGNCMFRAGTSCTIAEAAAAVCDIADTLDIAYCHPSDDATNETQE